MDLIRERGTGKGKETTGDYIFVFGIILLLIGLLVGSILVSLYILGLFLKRFGICFDVFSYFTSMKFHLLLI
jgi:hypothetical protein